MLKKLTYILLTALMIMLVGCNKENYEIKINEPFNGNYYVFDVFLICPKGHLTKFGRRNIKQFVEFRRMGVRAYVKITKTGC